MNWKSRFTVCVLILFLCSVCSTAFARTYSSGECEIDGYWQYTIKTDNTARIVGYLDEEAEGVLVIPETVGGHPVISVNGLSDMKQITKVVFPDTVRTIAAQAFSGDILLKEIELPSSLESIGESAFKRCGLTSVVIPASVVYIGWDAFSKTNLKSVQFIPGEEVRMTGNPFTDTEIERFSVPEDHPNLGTYQGVLFEKKEKKLISYPSLKDADYYEIPRGVKSIGSWAFYSIQLKQVAIPDTVVEIEGYAFSDTELTEVRLPDSIKIIGSGAFNSCDELRNIRLGEGLTELGDYAFSGCSSLSAIGIPENVRSIGMGVFNDCGSLLDIIVSEKNPFFVSENHCLIEKDTAKLIAYPGGLRTEMLSIPEGVKIVEENAFKGSDIQAVRLPDSMRILEAFSFYDMPGLTSVEMNSGLMYVGSYCFSGCYALEELTIPRSVGWIGHDEYNEYESLSVRLEKGSYAEAFCRNNNMPFSYLPASQETGRAPLPSAILGFSGFSADKVFEDVNKTVQTEKRGEYPPFSDRASAFPGGLNMQELKDFGNALFSSEVTDYQCPECMSGEWLITLDFERHEMVGNVMVSSGETRIIAGDAKQVMQIDGKEDLSHVSFARNGILYTFKPGADEVLFSISLSASSEEILATDDSWEIEPYSSAFLTWDNDVDEEIGVGGYRVWCNFTNEPDAPEGTIRTLTKYSPDGTCLGTEEHEEI